MKFDVESSLFVFLCMTRRVVHTIMLKWVLTYKYIVYMECPFKSYILFSVSHISTFSNKNNLICYLTSVNVEIFHKMQRQLLGTVKEVKKSMKFPEGQNSYLNVPPDFLLSASLLFFHFSLLFGCKNLRVVSCFLYFIWQLTCTSAK